MDIALLNSDRQPWNVLSQRGSAGDELFFFDHEKTLLGNGRPGGDILRVSSAALTEAKIGDYLQCVDANNAVLERLDKDALDRAFGSLQLTEEVLQLALSECPSEWIDSSRKDCLERLLTEVVGYATCIR